MTDGVFAAVAAHFARRTQGAADWRTLRRVEYFAAVTRCQLNTWHKRRFAFRHAGDCRRYGRYYAACAASGATCYLIFIHAVINSAIKLIFQAAIYMIRLIRLK